MSFKNSPVKVPEVVNADKRYFTAAEANRALPYVSRVAEDISCVYGSVIHLRRQLEEAELHDETAEVERQYERAMDRLSQLVDELHAVGVELKDFERGLVDFPALHQGREISLCWCRGEDQVTQWHEVDAGFAGRQPVELLED